METIVAFKQALWLAVMLSAPPLIAAAGLGIVVSILQALTQIQDQTLPYVVKLVGVSVMIALLSRWFGSELIQLMTRNLDLISSVGR
ncbi:type III secretion system export apparatus subunit SctS [Aquabacterium sp. A7-Y]|uniref:type III secretion system export apparatus subunit SctS n=1 Tax=Aquabacterium sp. A7-Y TaxID=1349605 RepID=UPI00223DB48F|nr:type III secretion system export apparatus subunit SctS [Aquabacterium sp. A7-Y]MCW7536985.1 type III secretion system export apparatus subunit SctS [Aquabacterium sp. A7-Y]